MKFSYNSLAYSLLSLSLFLIYPPFAPAQQKVIRAPANTSKPEPTTVGNRPVTIRLKDGESLKGTFIGANQNGIQISLAGNTLNLKWGDLSQIVFTDSVQSESSQIAERAAPGDAADNALKSLRKLAAAAEVGVNFQDYGRRVIDVKSEVDEQLSKIPEGIAKGEIRLAMQAYVDAGTAWNEMIRYDFMLPEFEPGKSLRQKYSIPTDTSIGKPMMTRRVVLSTIWGAARKHIENASAPSNDALVSTTSSPSDLTSPPAGSAEISASEGKSEEVLEGRWSVTIYVADQSTSTTFSFTKVGSGYVGAATSPQGVTSFANLVFDGKSFSFTGVDKIENQQVTLAAQGDVLGDSLSGRLTITALTGQSVEGRFVGTRLK